jgi:cytochrome c
VVRFRFIFTCLALGILLAAWAAAAATPEQRAEILAVGTLMTKAGNLFNEKKFQEAGEAVKDAQGKVEKLAKSADRQMLDQLEPIYKRISAAHAKLKTEGIALPELKPLPDAKAAPAKTSPAAKTAPAAKGTAAKAAAKGGMGGVSFVKDVAPVLNARCGTCHVRSAKGQFSMATFDNLMKGPMQTGKVVFPGDVKSSVLIEKVEQKEMPPSGAGIPDGELAILKRWIQDGAKFDGPSTSAQLTSYLPTGGNQPAPTQSMTIQKATGKETVSFGLDIAPVLVKNCNDCHTGQNPRGNLNLSTLPRLVRGGDSGDPILPGKPAESLLIKRLKATDAKERMPQRRPALDAVTIKKFETWIAEGAKFDGVDASQTLTEVAAVAKAKASTHEQLTKDRAELAELNWRTGMPGAQPSKFESANFLVLGSVGENTLQDIAKRAESLVPKVGDIFKAPKDQPLVKGRVTLFVFGERYDYGEFGQMVEKRELSTAWRGHFRFSIVDAYGVVLTPKASDYDLDALIAQQLGAVYAASLGKEVPHWFAEGCGRVVAARMAPAGDRRVNQWDADLSGAVGSLAKPDDFINDKLAPEMTDICSFSFVKFLMSDSKKFSNLLDGLRKGGDFKKVFGESFGGTPEQVTVAWVRNPPKVGRLKGGK